MILKMSYKLTLHYNMFRRAATTAIIIIKMFDSGFHTWLIKNNIFCWYNSDFGCYCRNYNL